MVYNGNPIKMDDLGYHYFWKHPYTNVPMLFALNFNINKWFADFCSVKFQTRHVLCHQKTRALHRIALRPSETKSDPNPFRGGCALWPQYKLSIKWQTKTFEDSFSDFLRCELWCLWAAMIFKSTWDHFQSHFWKCKDFQIWNLEMFKAKMPPKKNTIPNTTDSQKRNDLCPIPHSTSPTMELWPRWAVPKASLPKEVAWCRWLNVTPSFGTQFYWKNTYFTTKTVGSIEFYLKVFKVTSWQEFSKASE